MKKALPKTFLGFFMTLSGASSAFYYFNGTDTGKIWILAIAGPLIVAGLYFSKSFSEIIASWTGIDTSDTTKDKKVNSASQTQETTGLQAMLDRNNALVDQWSKSANNKERMKMLATAAEIEEQSKRPDVK